MYLFSVITICRNNLAELITTFESVKSQNFEEFEWIVIDGNSSDGTKEWLRNNPFAVKWISEKDDGIFDAMNKGIGLSNGKYLIFMNSGDAFADNQVLQNIEFAIKNKVHEPTLIFGDSVDIDEKGSAFYRKAKEFSKIKKGMITQHQAMLVNSSKNPDIKFLTDYKLTADYALICDIISRCKTEDILKLEFAVCKFSLGGTNESKRFKALAEDYHIRRNILKLSIDESSTLYILHFIHTIIKKTIPSFRFIKHDLHVNKN
jgi:putative colanic acid biosynthesis glycosyltransferase